MEIKGKKIVVSGYYIHDKRDVWCPVFSLTYDSVIQYLERGGYEVITGEHADGSEFISNFPNKGYIIDAYCPGVAVYNHDDKFTLFAKKG